MDHSNVFAIGNNQENPEKPPPQVCPRCKSDNTKFCYFNNYSVSQPRYLCKDCRRFWTQGGALRNIPIGGKCRKAKRARVDTPVPRTVSADIQQVNHQPQFSNVQENNEFVGSVVAASSSSSSYAAAAAGNPFSPLSDIHGSMVTNVSLSQSFQQNQPLNFNDGSSEQDYYDVGFGNPMINQSIGGYFDDSYGYYMNQVDQYNWNQSFNNATNMTHNASTSGSSGSDMNMNYDIDNFLL